MANIARLITHSLQGELVLLHLIDQPNLQYIGNIMKPDDQQPLLYRGQSFYTDVNDPQYFEGSHYLLKALKDFRGHKKIAEFGSYPIKIISVHLKLRVFAFPTTSYEQILVLTSDKKIKFYFNIGGRICSVGPIAFCHSLNLLLNEWYNIKFTVINYYDATIWLLIDVLEHPGMEEGPIGKQCKKFFFQKILIFYREFIKWRLWSC